MGSNVTFNENTCNIKGREGAHDPMYFHCTWKGWTKEQCMLQSKLSNEVEMQISKRPRLMKDQTQQHAVPYEDPCVGQGEEDEDEEEEEDEEEDEDKDEDESEDKDDDDEEGASEHDEVKTVEGEGNKEFPRGVEC